MSHETEHSMADSRRFTRLWVGAQPIVSAFVYSSIRNRTDAEDVLQTVAGAALEDFSKYDGSGSFTAWIMGIARYRILNYYRSRHRDRHVFGEQAIAKLAEAHQQLEGIVDPYREALEICMDRLPPRQRQMLSRRYREDLSASQIAEQAGMSANAVSVTLHRIRQALARCIESRLGAEVPRG